MDYSSDDIPNSYDDLELRVDFSDEEKSCKMETCEIELPDETACSIIETASNIRTAENIIETVTNNTESAESNIYNGFSIINDVSVKNREPTRSGNWYLSLMDHNYHKNSKKMKKIQYCGICFLEINQFNLRNHQTYCRDRVFKCSPNKIVLHNETTKWMSTSDIKIHQALNAIFEGFEVKVASNIFGLNENELKEKLKCIGAKIPQNKTLDNIIATHLKLLQKKCFKLSEYSIRRIAYELALINKQVNINIYGLADESWYTQFIKNHPVLADLRADFIDRKAMMTYQKLMVLAFFDSYVQTIMENSFDRNTIYTVETASIVLSSADEVLNPKTDKRASIIVAANCLGDISPAVISSTFNLYQTQTDHSLTLEDQRLGRIDSETFRKFANNFVKYVKPRKRPFLLLVNDNDYFSQSYETYVILKRAHIHILGVPNIMINKLPLGFSLFNRIIGRMQLIIHDKHMDGETVVSNFSNLFSWGKNLTPSLICKELKDGFLNCGLAPIKKENALQWIQETMGKSSKNIFRLIYIEKEKDQNEEEQIEEDPTEEEQIEVEQIEVEQIEEEQIEDDQIEEDQVEKDQIQTDSTLNLENTHQIVKQEHSTLNLDKIYPTVKQEVFETSEYISETLVRLSEITSGDCNSYERPKTPEILDRYINESAKHNLKDLRVNLTLLPEHFLKRLKKIQSLSNKKKPIESSGNKKKRKSPIKCPICYKLFKKSHGGLWIQCVKCNGWTHDSCATLTDKTFFFCIKCVLT